MPAQAAGAPPGENHPRLPACPHDRGQAMHPPHRHQVYHAAAPDQQDVLRQQMRLDIGNAGLREQREHAEVDVPTAAENLGHRFNGGRRITGSGRDEADPFLPVASGEAHRVLKERRVRFLTWGAVQDPGESEHLSRPDGHSQSLTDLYPPLGCALSDATWHDSDCRTLLLESNTCSIQYSRISAPTILFPAQTTPDRSRCRSSGWRRRSASWPGTWPRRRAGS